MTTLKYELKQIMTELKFDIAVYKTAPKTYELSVSEMSRYGDGDLYYCEIGIFTTKREAVKEQQLAFMYMKENGFDRVRMRYSDLS